MKKLLKGNLKKDTKYADPVPIKKVNIKFDIPKLKKDVLIIHDSFFDEAYAPNTYLSNYFNLEYQRWSEDIDLGSNAKEFDFVLIESSIETFFETRISYIEN